MVVDVASLRVRIAAETQQAEQRLRSLGTSIDQTGSRARGAQGGVSTLGRSVNTAGQQAGQAGTRMAGLGQGVAALSPIALGATGAVAGLGLAARNSVQASIAWESSLAGVAKTLDTTGLSAEQADAAVQDIGNALREMALEIPITANELAGVAEAAGQLGVARGDVVEFTETMALLGVATDLTAEQSATAIARIANITGLATEDVDRFGSALVDLGNNSAATESEILNMATRIAAAGTQAGLTEGEILGLAATLTSVGVNAEAGGTAIVQVMNEITTSVETADDRLVTFAAIAGKTAEEFAATWRANPSLAITEFIEGLGNLSARGGSTVQILDELELDGIRVSQALNSAAGAGDLMRDSMARGNTAFEENNALNEEAARRFETTASEVQLAKNEMHEAAIVAGDELAPAYAFLIRQTAEFTRHVGEAVGALGNFKRGLQDLDLKGTGNSLIDLGEALGLTIRDFGQVQDETGETSREMAAWGGVMAAVTSEIEKFSTVYGPSFFEYLTVVQMAREETGELSDTVETWLQLQHESAIRAMGVAETVTDQTMALEENELALSGLVDTSHDAARAAVAHAQAQAFARDILYDVESALGGLAGAYQAAGEAAGIFNAQSSEYSGIASSLKDAYDAINEKKEAGIALSDAEIAFLEQYPGLYDSATSAQSDATVTAGLWAAAQAEVIEAQWAVNAGLDDAPAKLAEAARSIQVATDASGIMTDAQRDLLESILGVQVGLDGLDGQEANIAVNLLEGAGSTAGQRGGPTRAEQLAEDLGITGRIGNIKGDLTALNGSEAEVTAKVDDEDARTDLEYISDRVAYFQSGGGNFTIVASVNTSQVDAAIQYIDDSLPHSPARRGPLSREPDWSFLFKTLPYEAGVASDAAVNIIANPGRGPFGSGASYAEVGHGAGREFAEGFVLEFPAIWNEMWIKAFDFVENLFINDPLELFSGDAVDALQEKIVAYEAFLGSLIQAGFGPGSPVYDEAFTAYQQLLRDMDAASAIAGTESAQDYWDAWNEAHPPDWRFPEIEAGIGDAAFDWGEHAAERFWDGFAAGSGRPGEGPGSIIDEILGDDDIVVGVVVEYDLKPKDGVGGEDRTFVEEIEAIGQEGLEAWERILTEYPEVSGQIVDDIIQAAIDGRIPWSEAMRLLALVPDEELIPALDALERKIAVDLAEAIAEHGIDSPEAQAYLRLLEAIGLAAEEAAASVSTLTEEQQALIQGDSNIVAEAGPGGTPVGVGGSGEADLYQEDRDYLILAHNLVDGARIALADTPLNRENIDPSDWLSNLLHDKGTTGTQVFVDSGRINSVWGQSEIDELQNVLSVLPRNQISGFAHGGIAPGGMAWVGEYGPELVNLPAGSRVYSHDDSMRMVTQEIIAALQQGPNSSPIVIQPAPVILNGQQVGEVTFAEINSQLRRAL